MLACLNNLHHSGVFIPQSFIGNDLLDQMINIDVELPSKAAIMLRERCPFLPRHTVTNLVFTNLVNRQTAEHLHAATGFLLNIDFGIIKPLGWNKSLARAYLMTDSLEDLISIMVKSSQGQQTEQHIFRLLEQIVSLTPEIKPDSTKEQVLTPVLQELVRLNIGVPSNVVNNLSRQITSEAGKDLLNQAEKRW